MQKFAGTRSINEINKELKKRHWPCIDKKEYEKGSDYVSCGCLVPIYDDDRMFGTLVINIFNGHFIVADGNGKMVTTSDHEEYEEAEWFKDILNVVYKPLEEATQ